MKTIEHRRHSIRNQEGPHLNQSGVDLARKVGNKMDDNYQLVITSGKERAFETAVAMGYAVDKQIDELNTFGDEVMNEIENWNMPFSEIKMYYDKQGPLYNYCHDHEKLLLKILEKIDEGRSILIISHGGVTDYPLVHLFPNSDVSLWGNNFSYCEGYKLYYEDNKFNRFDLLRA
ncbi:MAG: histidine phosphatase family protein [Candidatus Kariarchaeaceae archaeon]|jgi:broad specificity phosphatase PhoE